jgi:hypothetical protein
MDIVTMYDIQFKLPQDPNLHALEAKGTRDMPRHEADQPVRVSLPGFREHDQPEDPRIGAGYCQGGAGDHADLNTRCILDQPP